MQDLDGAGAAIDADGVAGAQPPGRVGDRDDTRHTKLAGDDRPVTQGSAGLDD